MKYTDAGTQRSHICMHARTRAREHTHALHSFLPTTVEQLSSSRRSFESIAWQLDEACVKENVFELRSLLIHKSILQVDDLNLLHTYLDWACYRYFLSCTICSYMYHFWRSSTWIFHTTTWTRLASRRTSSSCSTSKSLISATITSQRYASSNVLGIILVCLLHLDELGIVHSTPQRCVFLGMLNLEWCLHAHPHKYFRAVWVSTLHELCTAMLMSVTHKHSRETCIRSRSWHLWIDYISRYELITGCSFCLHAWEWSRWGCTLFWTGNLFWKFQRHRWPAKRSNEMCQAKHHAVPCECDLIWTLHRNVCIYVSHFLWYTQTVMISECLENLSSWHGMISWCLDMCMPLSCVAHLWSWFLNVSMHFWSSYFSYAFTIEKFALLSVRYFLALLLHLS